MGAHNYTLTLRNLGRDIEDEYAVDLDHAEFWLREHTELSKFNYEHNGVVAAVFIQWSDLANRISAYAKQIAKFRKGGYWVHERYLKVAGPVSFSATVDINGQSELTNYPWFAAFFLELAIYDTFFIANLAFPGVANFYSLSFERDPPHEPAEPRLSSFYMDNSWVASIRGKWPTLKRLDVSVVRSWYSSLQIGIRQKADGGTVSAVFAFLHLCRHEGGIDSLVWIFHALEALLGTHVGENTSSIHRRVSLLLGATTEQSANLKKRLRKVYELRSAFVHGGYPVIHPIGVEVIDRSIVDQQWPLMEANEFGVSLLTALFQEFAARGLTTARFEEHLVSHGSDA